MGSCLSVAWVVTVALHVACGRVGFDPQGSTVIDGPSADAPDVPATDGPLVDASDPNAPDGLTVDPDALAACNYNPTCGGGDVTCCDNGAPACVADTTVCARRFECDVLTNEGCFGGELCCLTMGSTGTECVNVSTEMCFG